MPRRLWAALVQGNNHPHLSWSLRFSALSTRARHLFWFGCVFDGCTEQRAVRTDQAALALDSTADDTVPVYPWLAVKRYIE